MGDFNNKVVIVTGAAGALGRAVTEHFLSRDASVACLDYSEDLLTGAFPDSKAKSKLFTIVADLNQRTSCKEAIATIKNQFGQIDILANIAGGFMMGDPVHATNDETWDFLFNLNTRSIVYTSSEVVPIMLEQGAGKIVNIAARAAVAGAKNMGAYTASKAAVMRLTESMALELREQNINVNCILPGTIDTERNRSDMPNADYSKWVPTSDLANVIGFLCSEESSAVNGAGIPVYGLS
ncbi:MAG: SDR family NAD(P)-dependent oxidoreductase [Pseudomonadales bacterium]|nr:SDR family NAD(P)-dependent oxidoreductase [Pseudomonadales bacterium]